MSSKDVFVFGAGASKASAGLPLGRDLVWRYYPSAVLHSGKKNGKPTEEDVKRIRREWEPYEKFICLVEEVFPETRGLCSKWQRSIIDGGTFVSLIEPFFYPNAQKYYVDNIIRELQKNNNKEGIALVRRLIFEHITKPKNDLKENLYKKFLGKIDNDSIIMTLNFDALIERIILEDNKHFNYLLDFDCKEDSKNWYKEEGISLIKLNGSVNWGMCSQCSKICLFDDFWVKKENYENFRCKLTERCKGKVEPLIVIPHHKSTENKSLDLLWERAKRELETADKVTFIGYSFPDYDDDEAVELFKETGKTNLKAEIEIVDHADEKEIKNREKKWREKLKDIFPPRNDTDRIKIRFDGFEGYLESYQERSLAGDTKRSL